MLTELFSEFKYNINIVIRLLSICYENDLNWTQNPVRVTSCVGSPEVTPSGESRLRYKMSEKSLFSLKVTFCFLYLLFVSTIKSKGLR